MSLLKRIYLPNLDTIRALAALLVVFCHIELEKRCFGLTQIPGFIHYGQIGVTLFFVLSGFLITYLLLKEKQIFSKINIKDFYIRRVLRIWPLYILIIVFSYLVVQYLLPNYYLSERSSFTWNSFLLNFFFLTNVARAIGITPSIIGTIWSIGIEEQFCIFWPWIIKQKKYVLLVFLMIFSIPFLKFFLFVLKFFSNSFVLKIIWDALALTRFDSMAIGAFFAILAVNKQIIIWKFSFNYSFFTSKKIQIFAYFSLLFFFGLPYFFSFLFNIINYEIFPILFAICILNLATNQSSILNIENKISNLLGKISYSLYLNHLPIIYLFFPILKPLLVGYSNIAKNLIVYTTTLFLVILVSYLTYNFYEKQFLKLKHKFAHIRT